MKLQKRIPPWERLFFFNTKMTENYMRILAFLYVQIWTVLWACSEPIILYLTFGCYLRRFRLMPWSPRRWSRRWTERLLRTSLARRYLWNLQSWLLRFFITRSKLPLPWFHRNREIFSVAIFVLKVLFIDLFEERRLDLAHWIWRLKFGKTQFPSFEPAIWRMNFRTCTFERLALSFSWDLVEALKSGKLHFWKWIYTAQASTLGVFIFYFGTLQALESHQNPRYLEEHEAFF